MEAVIEMIIYPWAYTKCGKRIRVAGILGNPSVGATIEGSGDKWKVKGISNDSDCPNGVCPIK